MNFSVIIVLTQNKLAVPIGSVVHNTCPISKINQNFSTLIIHCCLKNLCNFFIKMGFREFFKRILIPNNIGLSQSILHFDSFNLVVCCPPDCTSRDIFFSKQTHSMKRTLFIRKFKEDRHLCFCIVSNKIYTFYLFLIILFIKRFFHTYKRKF